MGASESAPRMGTCETSRGSVKRGPTGWLALRPRGGGLGSWRMSQQLCWPFLACGWSAARSPLPGATCLTPKALRHQIGDPGVVELSFWNTARWSVTKVNTHMPPHVDRKQCVQT